MQMPIWEDSAVGATSNGEIIELSDRIITVFQDFNSDAYGCTVIFDDASILISTSVLPPDEVLEIAKQLN